MNKQILVLIEGWSVSDEAVRYAHALAQRIEGRLVLLLLLHAHPSSHEAATEVSTRGDVFLRDLIDPFDDAVAIDPHVRIGDPWSEFCKFVATTDPFHMAVWASETGLVNGRPSVGHWVSRIQGELGCPLVTAQRRTR